MEVKKELIEGIIQDLVKILCEEKAFSIEKSMDTIYNSLVFEKLMDIETGLYKESSSYIKLGRFTELKELL